MYLKKVNMELLNICIFISLFIVNIFNGLFVFNKYPDLLNFKDRIISNATVNGYDIGKRVNLFYAFLACIVILVIITYMITNLIFKKKCGKNVTGILTLASDLSVFGIATVCCGYLLGTMDTAVSYMGIFVLGILGIVMLLDNFNIDVYMVEWAGMMTITISIFIKTVFNITLNSLIITSTIFFILIVLLRLVNKSVKSNLETEKLHIIIIKSSFPLFITAFIQSILLEVFNILNRRGIWICKSPKLIYIIVVLSSILIGGVLFYLNKHKELSLRNSSEYLIQNIWYVVFIITICVIVAQPSRQILPGNEYFEAANHGLALDGLFRYGEIPIIQNFDAHMLLNQIMGILYYLLNGYEPWAFNIYSGYIILLINLIAYFLLSEVLNKRHALLLVIIFPFFNIIFPYFSIISIVLLYLFRLVSENKNWSALVFWCLVGAMILITLDMGLSAAMAGVFSYLFIVLEKRKNVGKYITGFCLSGIIVGLVALGLFTSMCLVKGISPLTRFIEFLKIVLSNANWAYSFIGNQKSIAFGIAYYIIPMILIGLVIFIIYKSILEHGEMKINAYARLGFLYFSIAYLVNIPRGIVRHSLAEATLGHILSYFPLACLCFTLIFRTTYVKSLYRLLVCLVVVSFIMKMNHVEFPMTSSLIANMKNSINSMEQYAPVADLSNGRVAGETLNDEIASFRKVLDYLLNDQETYLDMTSLNYYYALVERRKPVYVNQSPLLLSGELTQELFIEQIQKAEVPLAIIPIQDIPQKGIWQYIDGVNIMDKYYLISEYIFKNYEPLLRLNEFDVWCKKDRKIEFYSKLKIINDKKKEYLPEFNEEYTQNIVKNNIDVVFYNKTLSLKATGTDPYIYYTLQQNQLFNIEQQNYQYKAELTVIPQEAGNVQIFYTTKNNPGFSEEMSKKYAVKGSEETTLEVMLEEAPLDIRIDVEGIQEIDIKDLRLVEMSGIGELISHEDAVARMGPRDIGLIPWYWGNYDEKEIKIKSVMNLNSNILEKQDYIEVAITNADIKDFVQYINLEINSDVQQTVNMSLENKNRSIVPSVYNFTTKPGLGKYRIRIGADYGYYLKIYNTMKIRGTTSDINIINVDLEIENTNLLNRDKK